MNAQAGANTRGWLHRPATRLEQASTDVLEKKMSTQIYDNPNEVGYGPKWDSDADYDLEPATVNQDN